MDAIAAQLNELAASPRSNRQGAAGDRKGQRQSSVEDARRMGINQTSASNGQGKTFVGQPQPHLDEDEDGTSRYDIAYIDQTSANGDYALGNIITLSTQSYN